MKYPQEMKCKVGNTVLKETVNNLQEELSFIKKVKRLTGNLGE